MNEHTPISTTFLQAGTTCCMIAHANRAKVLIDADEYFCTLRRALLKAERSVDIVGWDIDSRTDLLPREIGDTGPDSAPTRLKPLLNHLVERRPNLKVRLLLWDYTILYALDREPLPQVNLNWATPPQIDVCLDDVLPLGACHHQKIVVIDDSLAFCGGLDLTQRRWDTSEHRAVDTRRTDSSGSAYEPFHDVQMMVGGEAAGALAEVVHTRWHEATCEAKPKVAPYGDPWPADVVPDFRDIPVGIARTIPTLHERPEYREVESLYCRAIERSERAIYIENQYLTSQAILEALAARLADNPDLQVLIVGPETPHGWIEAKSMGNGRRKFMQTLADLGYADRVRLVHPRTGADDGQFPQAIMVHSKLMVVDDRFLTVGSTNLNNRSFGLDTECNLAIEARRESERDAIAALRDRLLGEHLAVSSAEVSSAVDAEGIVGAVERLGAREGRTLCDLHDDLVFDDPLSAALHKLADPERPIAFDELSLEQFQGQSSFSPWVKILSGGAVLLLLVGSAFVWSQSSLSRFTDLDQLQPYIDVVRAHAWAPLAVPLIYLAASLAMFPVTVLITMTAMAFPPVSAFIYAIIGVVVSASGTYGVGALVGRRFLRRVMGKRLNRISRAIGRKGVVAVVGLRVAPVAPYSFVNMVAGASHIRFRDFTLGTVLGMAPGMLALVWLGQSIWAFLADPTPIQVALIALAALAWIGLGLGVQQAIDHWADRRGEHEAEDA